MQGPETRPSLLVRLRDASQNEAWEEFTEIYEPLVYRLARQNGFQHADAQDLTQEVFAVVGKAIDRFDPSPEKGSFRGWLFRIARNLMINFLTRQKGPRGTGDTGIQQLLNEQPAADDEAATLFEMEYQREIFRWAAQRVRQEFQEETWRAFWMTGVKGESIGDVARILGKTPGAIRIARCRVLARLKEEVTRFEEPKPV
ncbi:MAG: sigma-70 family RNA polymerase sigma factor [Planctomycetes bacterium]|nr:sigma-70 family RNA polymerase sigma factor [Planctomycetota bacterium]MBL7043052.1 sigma-70 family RNA polymerase sigma factor [Pirellulaceae bacterium]